MPGLVPGRSGSEAATPDCILQQKTLFHQTIMVVMVRPIHVRA